MQFFEVARERFLKPGGKLIPSSVDLFVTLMECPELFQFTFVPHLSLRGHARLCVLTLCDGKRPLSEIEQEIFRLHPKLFKIAAEAATFVAEVVTRYSR